MNKTDWIRRQAFTLIELLVVVAIIALLISILLPSLKCARENARTAKCGVQLRGLGSGLQTYASENNSWFPGANTTGLSTSGSKYDVNALRRSYIPVQNFDWMSPALKYDTDLGDNRAKRFQALINEYRCPTFDGIKIDYLHPPGLAASLDKNDFTPDIEDSFAPLSYLMPVHFQWWSRKYFGQNLANISIGGRDFPIAAKVSPDNFEAVHYGSYKSRIDKVGPPARKIAAADGMRYLTQEGLVDFDVAPDPTFFGSFTSSGAWWSGSTVYGVQSNTMNWDNTSMSRGSPSEGRSLVWSYRHGCTDRGKQTSSVRDNSGAINAMFFDGHVARLEDKASRNIEFWYPTGARVNDPSEGLTDVPAGYEVQ